MKNTKLILYLIFIFSLVNISLSAQVVEITLNVQTAGTLHTLINASKKNQISKLTLLGKLNGDDILFIREMIGRDYSDNVTLGSLSVLDISGVNIVSGGGYYYYDGYNGYNYYTLANTISGEMFRNCTKLASIALPNNITSIEKYAFYGCTGLTTLLIPNSVTNFGSYSFYGCTGLTSINIPSSVTSIGDVAFYNCSGLTSLTIPNSVIAIGSDAFNGCKSLTSLNIPNSVTTLGDYTFGGCSGLTNVIIGNGVPTIGISAFSGCTGLTTITIPNNVTKLGDRSFNNCVGLTSIIIGSGVTSIGSEVFLNCKGLTQIIADSKNLKFSSLDGVLFNKNSTSIIAYPNAKSAQYSIPNIVVSVFDYAFKNCTGLTSITIPNSVTSIGRYAFGGCTGLNYVTLGNSVTSFGYNAFGGCTGLNEIHCNMKTPPIINSDAFSNVDKGTCKLYVAKGYYSSYWVANVWGDFTNIIEEELVSIPKTIALNTNIISEGNSIIIKDALVNEKISVYSVLGKIFKITTVTDPIMRIEVPKNQIYIVKLNERAYKIAL